MSTLGRRLGERKIVQWAITYLAAAWLLLQLLDVLSPLLGISLAAQRLALVALGVGFLVTLVLAWYHGEQGRQRVSGPELLILAAVMALGGGALALVPGGVESPGLPPPSDGKSVAVLPFTDLSPDGDQAYFADGIAEELTSAVDRIPGLRVAARTSAFAFRGSDRDIREIGRQLGVETVVEGSLRKNADRLRIEARVVNVADGFPLWSQRFRIDAADIFDVQDSIARAVAEALEIRLAGVEDQLRLPGQTADYEAQDHYLRGRHAWNRRSRESLEEAVRSFQAALERDPEYARALVGLGDAYAVLGFYDHRPPAEAFPLAREAASRALEIEPRLAEPHATLGYVALYYDWDWERAETEFRRAIDLDPEYAVGRQWYANYLVAMGRFEEAAREMRGASELDPLSTIAHAATGWAYYHAGEYEQAVARLEQTIAREPEFQQSHLWIGQALGRLGRLDEGAAHISRYLALTDSSDIGRAALARSHADLGREAEARRILVQLAERGADTYVPSYEIAVAWAPLDPDRALDWLERARAERAHSIAFLAVDPQLAPLRGRPDFDRLVSELDLDHVRPGEMTPSTGDPR